jgi:cold shock protein
LVTGRVLHCDHARGYGFAAADDGGEDLFLHASVFDGDPDELAPGTKMEFNVMAGDRGRKAFAAHLIDDGLENDLVPPPRQVSPSGPQQRKLGAVTSASTPSSQIGYGA